MKENKFDIILSKRKKKVKLHNDGYGIELLTMRNGHQWTGSGVDDELIDMIIEVLNKYKDQKAKNPG